MDLFASSFIRNSNGFGRAKLQTACCNQSQYENGCKWCRHEQFTVTPFALSLVLVLITNTE
jgi:hypothetical protein